MEHYSNIDNHPLKRLVRDYLVYLQFERRLSSNTIDAYWRDLSKYSDFLYEVNNLTSPQKITLKHVRSYIHQFSSIVKPKSTTLSRILSSLRGFHYYLLLKGLSKKDPTELCSCRKPKPELILQASNDLNIKLDSSWFFGDSESDIIALMSKYCRTQHAYTNLKYRVIL